MLLSQWYHHHHHHPHGVMLQARITLTLPHHQINQYKRKTFKNHWYFFVSISISANHVFFKILDLHVQICRYNILIDKESAEINTITKNIWVIFKGSSLYIYIYIYIYNVTGRKVNHAQIVITNLFRRRI